MGARQSELLGAMYRMSRVNLANSPSFILRMWSPYLCLGRRNRPPAETPPTSPRRRMSLRGACWVAPTNSPRGRKSRPPIARSAFTRAAPCARPRAQSHACQPDRWPRSRIIAPAQLHMRLCSRAPARAYVLYRASRYTAKSAQTYKWGGYCPGAPTATGWGIRNAGAAPGSRMPPVPPGAPCIFRRMGGPPERPPPARVARISAERPQINPHG